MALFRFQRGGLTESMETLREVHGLADLAMLLNEQPENIEVRPYGYDNRIGWDTYIVTTKKLGVVGFLNAILEKS